MPIKLVYFPAKGRAELIRYILHQADAEFEDCQLTQEQWAEKKPMKAPFGQLPYVEIDGQVIGQSISIARFFANKFGLAGKTDFEKAKADQLVDGMVDLYTPMTPPLMLMYKGEKEKAMEELKKFEADHLHKFLEKYEKFLADNKTGFFVGDALTWADLAIAEFLDRYHGWSPDPKAFEKYTCLKKHHEMVYDLPKIKAYSSQRPKVAM